ncbi:MAG: WD40/YVTN/BNR-like repeat-containing protein [Candidatus Kapaibacterium sp.]
MNKFFLDLVVRGSWFVIRVFKSASCESRITIHVLFLFLLSSFILHPSSFSRTRLYACAIGSDSIGSSMGGNSLGAGLWQSDDTGRTWKQLGWKHVKCYSVDVVSKSNGNIIYEACGNGVLRSTDAGVNWKMVTDWRITEVMDIVVDQSSPKNIYIATAGAIWKSNDGGDNWYETDSDIPYPIFVSRIKVNPESHLHIYAATESGLYESKDGGLEWKKKPESGASVKDMIVTDNGLSSWIEESGAYWVYEGEKWNRLNIDSNSWTLCRYQGRTFTGNATGIAASDGVENLGESPANIHSLVTIADILFAGSLNGGVWRYDLSKENSICERSGLSDLQVWRLKTEEIK